eukprot:1155728-Pelagomonas_calceolata.AAC.5
MFALGALPVFRMTTMLRDPTFAASFDAQALSNSVWALAHIRTKMCDVPGKFEVCDRSDACCALHRTEVELKVQCTG